MIENEEGYEVARSYIIVSENIGEAEVQNYFGSRLLADATNSSY